MTAREKKLVFENEEFIKWIFTNKKKLTVHPKNIKYGKGYTPFFGNIDNTPHLLFIDLEKFVQKKFGVYISWDFSDLTLWKVGLGKLQLKTINYKTKWTGLLSALEWLEKEAKDES